jgi:hypothetical protein
MSGVNLEDYQGGAAGGSPRSRLEVHSSRRKSTRRDGMAAGVNYLSR